MAKNLVSEVFLIVAMISTPNTITRTNEKKNNEKQRMYLGIVTIRLPFVQYNKVIVNMFSAL